MTPFIAEIIGTALLLLLGGGVVANVSLKKPMEKQSALVLITTAWGFAVFVGAYVTGQFSGGHLNPAVTDRTSCNREICMGTCSPLYQEHKL